MVQLVCLYQYFVKNSLISYFSFHSKEFNSKKKAKKKNDKSHGVLHFTKKLNHSGELYLSKNIYRQVMFLILVLFYYHHFLTLYKKERFAHFEVHWVWWFWSFTVMYID